MKKLILLVVGLLCISGTVLAGEVITNDTGEDVTGLRVVFSTPVQITAFGDILTSVDPQMLSFEFVFSGSVVEPWGSHWFGYSPPNASVVEYEWLTGSFPSQIPQGSLTREDLWNLSHAPTYEEIMAAIAEYPGPDEPLYEPAPDEAIWLTDLEGHADIYDNDSIKINYAAWFDQSQVTEIEVYRNGIKMRFLPSMFNVLTNEQMKTFDGNLKENSPSSTHTDHAIHGYDFGFLFISSDEEIYIAKVVTSGIRYDPSYLYAHLGHGWWIDVFRNTHMPEGYALESLRGLRNLGFDGISFNVEHFVDSMEPTEIFAMHEPDPSIHPWSSTATLGEVRKILELADQAELDADVRMEVWLSEEYKRGHGGGGHREWITPSDIDAFFSSYEKAAVELARIAEEEGAAIFNPFTEMSSLRFYVKETQDLLNAIDAVFTGTLAVEEATCNMLNQPEGYTASGSFSDIASDFWNWTDDTGTDLMIQMSCWTPPLDVSVDQHLSACIEGFMGFWEPARAYYSLRYPGRPLYFGEMGDFNYDGQALGPDWSYERVPTRTRDDQELADIWAAYLIGSAAMGIDGTFIWNFGLAPWDLPGPDVTWLNGSPAELIIRAIAGIPPKASTTPPGRSAVPAWVGAIIEEPYAIAIRSSTRIVYYNEGCGCERPLSQATSWTGPGRELEGIQIILTEDGLAYRVQLVEGDSLGAFEYVISGNYGPHEIHIHLSPGAVAAMVTHTAPGTWEQIAVVLGDSLAQGEDWIAGLVPYEVIDEYIPRDRLDRILFKAHMAIGAGNRELFILNTSGRATEP